MRPCVWFLPSYIAEFLLRWEDRSEVIDILSSNIFYGDRIDTPKADKEPKIDWPSKSAAWGCFSSRTWPFRTTLQPLRSFTIHNSAATDTKPALRGHNPSHNNNTTGSCHQMAWSSGGSWITNIANIDRLCFPIANELFTIILCPTNPITAKCN